MSEHTNLVVPKITDKITDFVLTTGLYDAYFYDFEIHEYVIPGQTVIDTLVKISEFTSEHQITEQDLCLDEMLSKQVPFSFQHFCSAVTRVVFAFQDAAYSISTPENEKDIAVLQDYIQVHWYPEDSNFWGGTSSNVASQLCEVPTHPKEHVASKLFVTQNDSTGDEHVAASMRRFLLNHFGS